MHKPLEDNLNSGSNNKDSKISAIDKFKETNADDIFQMRRVSSDDTGDTGYKNIKDSGHNMNYQDNNKEDTPQGESSDDSDDDLSDIDEANEHTLSESNGLGDSNEGKRIKNEKHSIENDKRVTKSDGHAKAKFTRVSAKSLYKTEQLKYNEKNFKKFSSLNKEVKSRKLKWIDVTGINNNEFLAPQYFRMNNLELGSSYVIKIRIRNAIGWSKYSKPSEMLSTSPTMPPQKPNLLVSTPNYFIIQFYDHLEYKNLINKIPTNGLNTKINDIEFETNWNDAAPQSRIRTDSNDLAGLQSVSYDNVTPRANKQSSQRLSLKNPLSSDNNFQKFDHADDITPKGLLNSKDKSVTDLRLSFSLKSNGFSKENYDAKISSRTDYQYSDTVFRQDSKSVASSAQESSANSFFIFSRLEFQTQIAMLPVNYNPDIDPLQKYKRLENYQIITNQNLIMSQSILSNLNKVNEVKNCANNNEKLSSATSTATVTNIELNDHNSIDKEDIHGLEGIGWITVKSREISNEDFRSTLTQVNSNDIFSHNHLDLSNSSSVITLIDQLTPKTTYLVRVRVRTIIGLSPWSESLMVTTRSIS